MKDISLFKLIEVMYIELKLINLPLESELFMRK